MSRKFSRENDNDNITFSIIFGKPQRIAVRLLGAKLKQMEFL